jgi:hypothetical protein
MWGASPVGGLSELSECPAGIYANRLGLQWRTKEGVKKANYFGSVTQVGAQTHTPLPPPHHSRLPTPAHTATDPPLPPLHT